MNGKLFVIISIPSIELELDTYIPTSKRVGTVKNLIISVVEELSNGIFVNDGCKKIYDKQTGNVINDNDFVRYSTIKNGSRLIIY